MCIGGYGKRKNVNVVYIPYCFSLCRTHDMICPIYVSHSPRPDSESLGTTHSPKWQPWACTPLDLKRKDSAHNLTNHIAPLWGIPHQMKHCSRHNVTGLQWLSSCQNLESPRIHVSTVFKALFVCLPRQMLKQDLPPPVRLPRQASNSVTTC